MHRHRVDHNATAASKIWNCTGSFGNQMKIGTTFVWQNVCCRRIVRASWATDSSSSRWIFQYDEVTSSEESGVEPSMAKVWCSSITHSKALSKGSHWKIAKQVGHSVTMGLMLSGLDCCKPENYAREDSSCLPRVATPLPTASFAESSSVRASRTPHEKG